MGPRFFLSAFLPWSNPVLGGLGCRMLPQAVMHLHPRVVLSSLPSTLETKVRELIYPFEGRVALTLETGSASVTSWVYRACVVQGSQQIYVTFLWYWGSAMAAATQAGSTRTSLADSNPGLLIGVGLGIAVLLWGIAAIVFFGLPDYYRQAPGKIPAFYLTLFRRKVILVCLA